MPALPVSAVVIACDHFLPSGKRIQLYEFHVVVWLEDKGRMVRLRTDRCGPILLMNMLPLSTTLPTLEDVEAVAEIFAPGQRIQFYYWSVLSCLQKSEHGFHPMDVAVQPRGIEALHCPAPCAQLRVIEGGRG